MRSLYGPGWRYTPEGMTLDEETQRAVGELFRRYVTAGYSPREISHVMQGAIGTIEMSTILDAHPEVEGGVELVPAQLSAPPLQ